jgi:tRNA nucleotidyltransferase (CCA-adding enzyme)
MNFLPMILKKIDFPLKDLFIKIFEDKVYLVGGTIRDYLLYKEINLNQDIDLVVIDHGYDEIEKKLSGCGKTNTVGKSFAVVKFTREGHSFDISIPRRDVKKEKESHSHKNFIIEYGPHIKLEEDLKRRDFTCNSLALRLIDHKLVDPFNGARSIREKKITMTGPDTFFDDPLRILRCARFSSVHHFSVDLDIYSNAKNVNLNELSKERIQEELYRLLLESDQPSLGLNEYFKLSVLEKIFPALFKLTMTIQDSIFHPERDEYGHHSVWAHTLITVDIARKVSRMFELDEENSLALLLAALLHDIGKPATTKWEFKRNRMTVTSLSHDSKGGRIADSFLSELKIETRSHFPLKATILDLIKNHHRIYDLYRNKEEIGFKAISRIVKDLNGHDFLLALLDFSDRQSRRSRPLAFTRLDRVTKWFFGKKEELNISKETIKPLILGRDLLDMGVPPGKKMGELLKKLYELQLDGEFDTREDGLKLFKKLNIKI